MFKTSQKRAEKEFRKFARNNLLKPSKCRRIDETNDCIFKMHEIIQVLRKRFNYVPDSAQLMMNKYQNIQDRMVYENFRRSYNGVL